jgi:hypothetical protein
MLLKAGADPLAVNRLRLTPVQLAQRGKHTAAAVLLQRAAEDKLKAHTDKQS